MRAFSRISATGVPGPEGSIQKIFWSELNQRLQQVAQELLGPYGQLEGRRRPRDRSTARGRTATCARAATRLKPARRKFSATSSAISCSACREATDAVRIEREPGRSCATARASSLPASARWRTCAALAETETAVRSGSSGPSWRAGLHRDHLRRGVRRRRAGRRRTGAADGGDGGALLPGPLLSQP